MSGGDGCDNGQKRSTADTALQQKMPLLKMPPLKRPTPCGGKNLEEAALETRANTAEMALAQARQRASVKQQSTQKVGDASRHNLPINCGIRVPGHYIK